MADGDTAVEEGELLPVNPNSPTPHLDKLQELLKNDKLPAEDKERVARAIERYRAWIQAMALNRSEGDDRVRVLVNELNAYKQYIELELIWDSGADFLFRQRGQLKLDNSVIEEFIPALIDPRVIPALKGKTFQAGPRTSFAAVYFTTTLVKPAKGAGLQTRTKAQDFTVGRTAYLRASFNSEFPHEDTVTHEIYLAFVAAECKTNLDKTMFQEAIATAHDLKIAVPGARYYLLCEWLDMTPISTKATSIDEVILLRGKRLGSNVRAGFARTAEREKQREWYRDFLSKNPIRFESVLRFVTHLRALFDMTEPKEDDVLTRGYF
jgi:Bpu10I-like restriction endonuclease